jgi:hypothetical protein
MEKRVKQKILVYSCCPNYFDVVKQVSNTNIIYDHAVVLGRGGILYKNFCSFASNQKCFLDNCFSYTRHLSQVST